MTMVKHYENTTNDMLLQMALAGRLHVASKHRGGWQPGPKTKKATVEIPKPYESERGYRKNLLRKATALRVKAEIAREKDMRATLGRNVTDAERIKAFKSLASVELLASNLLKGWKPDVARTL